MNMPVLAVASCTGCVFVMAGPADSVSLYHKRQLQPGNWSPFEPTDPDGRWPYASDVYTVMSAATYQNPKGSVGYVTFGGVDDQLYVGAPAWGNSGPLLTPPLPFWASGSNLSTESYILYISDESQLVLVDFAQIMGIVPSTNSFYWALQNSHDQFGLSAAVQNSEGLWVICGNYGQGRGWIVRQSVDAAGVHWSDFSDVTFDSGGYCFNLCLLNQTLYMLLFDEQQVWVKRLPPFKRVFELEREYALNSFPNYGIGGIPPAIIVTSDNYLLLFWVSVDGQLWRGQCDGTPPVTWENAGAPPGATLAHLAGPAVSIGTTGNIEVFAVSTAGDLWQMWHTTETGIWSEWYLHGSPSA